SPATTTKHGTTRSPTSTNTSLRDVARRRPCEVIRVSCAGVSFGNRRSGRETVTAKGVCVVTGSGVSMVNSGKHGEHNAMLTLQTRFRNRAFPKYATSPDSHTIDSWPLRTHRLLRHAFAIRWPRFISERSS